MNAVLSVRSVIFVKSPAHLGDDVLLAGVSRIERQLRLLERRPGLGIETPRGREGLTQSEHQRLCLPERERPAEGYAPLLVFQLEVRQPSRRRDTLERCPESLLRFVKVRVSLKGQAEDGVELCFAHELGFVRRRALFASRWRTARRIDI